MRQLPKKHLNGHTLPLVIQNENSPEPNIKSRKNICTYTLMSSFII